MGGVHMPKTNTPRNHKLWWQSSYDRGLDILLKLWPRIKEKYPDAELTICYGWDLFIKGYSNNPERMSWLDRMNKLMEQDGITHLGRIGQDKMKELRKEHGIWPYCTYFTEISCIGALEAQKDGLIPVTMTLGALDETVQTGYKVEGDIYEPEVQDKWLEALFKAMEDKPTDAGKKWSDKFTWDKIANLWLKEFQS